MCSGCTSDVKIAIVGHAKLQIVCDPCGEAELVALGGRPAPVNQSQWSGVAGLQGRSSFRMLHKDGVAIRVKPAYPGERIKAVIPFQEVFQAVSVVPIQHVHTDGVQYKISFYQLADGRGWVHDFSNDNPGYPCVVPEAAPAAGVMVAQPVQPQAAQPLHGQQPSFAPQSPRFVQPPVTQPFVSGPTMSVQPAQAMMAQPASFPKYGTVGPPMAVPLLASPVPMARPIVPPHSGDVRPVVLAQPTGPTQGLPTYECIIKEGIAVRKAPVYPGDKTLAVITHNQKFLVASSVAVNHTHNDKVYSIIFYEIADGSGWVHNFSTIEPEKPTVVLALA